MSACRKGKETLVVHNEIHAIDLAIIAAYLIAMVLIGLVVVKKVKKQEAVEVSV